MTAKHARLAPSASKRWIACPGSIKLSDQVPTPPSSDAAEEGTAAHMLAERCLNAWLNKAMIKAESAIDTVITTEFKKFVVDDEMAEGVQVYLDAVDELWDVGQVLTVEEKFSLEWLHPGMFGSNDSCVYDPDTKHLSILDLKYGRGIVEPEWNSQLMTYALGAVYSIWSKQTKEKAVNPLRLFNQIDLVIVQPRAFHSEGPVRKWTISAQDLMFWGMQVLRPAAVMTENENAALRSGEHCRFCPALAVCPEHAKSAALACQTDFNKPVLRDPSMLSPQDLVKVLDVSETFNNWAKGVKAYAQNKMEGGVSLPGYKLVAKKSNRKWNSEQIAGAALENAMGEAAYVKKVLSVAKAEAALKKLKISPESALSGLWQKPDNGLTMASVDDRRKEVSPPAALDFLEDEDFLN